MWSAWFILKSLLQAFKNPTFVSPTFSLTRNCFGSSRLNVEGIPQNKIPCCAAFIVN
jgi:hypothetical protein